MWNLNDVIRIEYKSGYSYLVEFDNGVNAVIDFCGLPATWPGLCTAARPANSSVKPALKVAPLPGPMGRTSLLRRCTRSANKP